MSHRRIDAICQWNWMLVACVGLLIATSFSARAEDTMEPSLRGEDRVISLPYGFWNETFGTAAAYVYAINGYPQPQAGLLGTIMAGTKGSALAFLMGQNIRPFSSERLFFDPIVSVAYYNDADVYINGDPRFPNNRAGSNSSSEHDFITGSGWDTSYRLRFKYLLPIGSARDQVLPAYKLSDGLLIDGASGATSWNPLRSGRTFLELSPFYRTQNINNKDIDQEQSTNGLEFNVFWDNRDYPHNPSRGNALTLGLSRDFGFADSSASWTNVSAEYDQYVSFGEIKGFRQFVLALDVWSAFSPTWDAEANGTIAHRPPAFAGATLGGLFRMRAYPSQRFSDKAAVYYAAELRMIPNGNFFDRWPGLQKHVGVDWIQLIVFGETGRVAPRYSISELHSNMRWDAGLGLRLWAKGLVVRVDTAVSDEGLGVQMMVGHPFQF